MVAKVFGRLSVSLSYKSDMGGWLYLRIFGRKHLARHDACNQTILPLSDKSCCHERGGSQSHSCVCQSLLGMHNCLNLGANIRKKYVSSKSFWLKSPIFSKSFWPKSPIFSKSFGFLCMLISPFLVGQNHFRALSNKLDNTHLHMKSSPSPNDKTDA